MDKINSRQLFGNQFVCSHLEIFPEEACVYWNSSSPLRQPEDTKPDVADIGGIARALLALQKKDHKSMRCFYCGKEMERDDGGSVIKGIVVNVCNYGPAKLTPADIEYNNRQLGKYGNGQGQCDVAICYECYIDNLFGVGVQ